MLEKGGSAGGDGESVGEGDAANGAPKVDLSLKQGEKIKISIGGGSKVGLLCLHRRRTCARGRCHGRGRRCCWGSGRLKLGILAGGSK